MSRLGGSVPQRMPRTLQFARHWRLAALKTLPPSAAQYVRENPQDPTRPDGRNPLAHCRTGGIARPSWKNYPQTSASFNDDRRDRAASSSKISGPPASASYNPCAADAFPPPTGRNTHLRRDSTHDSRIDTDRTPDSRRSRYIPPTEARRPIELTPSFVSVSMSSPPAWVVARHVPSPSLCGIRRL